LYIRVTVVAMETQNYLLFVLLIYTCLCQLCHKYWKLCHGKKAMLSLCCYTTYVATHNTEQN